MTPNEQALYENYQIIKAERDELLEALESVLYYAENEVELYRTGGDGDEDIDRYYGEAMAAIRTARAAIAKARRN